MQEAVLTSIEIGTDYATEYRTVWQTGASIGLNPGTPCARADDRQIEAGWCFIGYHRAKNG